MGQVGGKMSGKMHSCLDRGLDAPVQAWWALMFLFVVLFRPSQYSEYLLVVLRAGTSASPWQSFILVG